MTETRNATIAHSTIGQLIEQQRSGTLSAIDIVEHFLREIEAKNDQLRAMIAVNPDARKIARQLDETRKSDGVSGALHGIPIVVKDNIETLDPMATTVGSLALAGNITQRDAPVAASLRAAGAVILGKANLSEWANFRSPNSSSGWSAMGGQTRNSHDVSRSPCGSSSGSAVAVAAGMAVAAVGTETSGSIVCPASVNGVVGVKPTVGWVSQNGIVPISHSQDTAGPLARCVSDAARLMQVIAGTSEVGPTEQGLAGRRLGVVRSLAGYHPAVDACLDDALATLTDAGATLIDGLRFERSREFRDASINLLLFEFKAGLNRYLSGLPGAFGELTLAKLIEFNDEHGDVELVHFGQELFHAAQEKAGLNDPDYLNALSTVRRCARDEGIDALLGEHDLDALLAPTGSPAWSIDWVNGDHFLGGSAAYPAAAGYPHISLPMGRVKGLPVGLSIFGARDADMQLLDIAGGFERATSGAHLVKG